MNPILNRLVTWAYGRPQLRSVFLPGWRVVEARKAGRPRLECLASRNQAHLACPEPKYDAAVKPHSVPIGEACHGWLIRPVDGGAR